MTVGFALCGSFCTYHQVFPTMEKLAASYDIIPVFSGVSSTVDSRFGAAADHIRKAMVTGVSAME